MFKTCREGRFAIRDGGLSGIQGRCSGSDRLVGLGHFATQCFELPGGLVDIGLLTTQLSWQNSYKAIGGMLRGLQDEALMESARLAEDIVGHPLPGSVMRGGSLHALREQVAAAKAA